MLVGTDVPGYVNAFPDNNFSLDFGKLTNALIRHVSREAKLKEPLEVGDLIISTSIFRDPPGVDQWPADYPESCTTEGIERVQNSAFAREKFAQGALANGYSSSAIFPPKAEAVHREISE